MKIPEVRRGVFPLSSPGAPFLECSPHTGPTRLEFVFIVSFLSSVSFSCSCPTFFLLVVLTFSSAFSSSTPLLLLFHSFSFLSPSCSKASFFLIFFISSFPPLSHPCLLLFFNLIIPHFTFSSSSSPFMPGWRVR